MKTVGKLAKVRVPRTAWSGWSENWYKIDEDQKDREEEKLCMSITQGFARRNREKRDIGRGSRKRVLCIDDVSGNEVRQALEQESKTSS